MPLLRDSWSAGFCAAHGTETESHGLGVDLHHADVRGRRTGWLRDRRFQTQRHGFGHALAFLLLQGEPTGKGGFLPRYTLHVAADACHVVGFYALQFRLNVDNFFRLPCPLCLNLLPLLGLVGIQGMLTRFGVLLHLVKRDAGCIKSQQQCSPLHLIRQPADVFAVKHFDHFVNAVALPRNHDPSCAINILHGQQLDWEGWDLSRGTHRSFFRGLSYVGHKILLLFTAVAVSVAAGFAVSRAAYAEALLLLAPW